MEIINKKLLKILVCPQCHSSFKIIKQELVCLNRNCQSSFLFKKNIPILLPKSFQKSKDFLFKKAQIDFFDQWSKKEIGIKKIEKTSFDRFFYSPVGNKKINYAENEMRQVIKSLPQNSLVLELGCGAGEHTAFLASLRKDIWLVAIDISFKSILETQKRLNEENAKCRVDFIVADAEKLPLKNNSVDGLFAVMFFHHVASPKKSLKEIKRIIKNKRIALIVDLIGNNVLMVFARRLFVHLPSFLKEKFKEDYLLPDGQIPEVKLHRIEKIKKTIKNLGFKTEREERYELFVSDLHLLGKLFPLIKYLLPEIFLNFLYNIEERLLRQRFFRKFAGAASLWLSK